MNLCRDKREWLLLIPPFGDCTMPTLGPFLLSSYLKKNGITAHVFDTSIQLLHNVLTDVFIRRIGRRQGKTSEEISFLLSFARTAKRSTDNFIKLSAAAKILSALSNNIVFTIDEAKFPYSINNTKKLKNILSQLSWLMPAFEFQPFWKFLAKTNSVNVGISISYSSQLPFALTLARAIKRSYPDVSINLGGAFFSNYDIPPSSILRTCPYVDSVIIGRGEEWLLRMSLVYRHYHGVLHAPDDAFKEYIPDFSGVRWSLYCVNRDQRSIPFSLRTSCYYGKCAFCTGDKDCSPKQKLTEHEIFDIIAKLKRLCRRKSITNVYFTDAALSPSTLVILAKMIGGCFRWAINSRMDAIYHPDFFKTLHSGGCDMLRIGMESYSQRVLDLMNKGTNATNFIPFITSATNSGIKLHIYIMYGFPGEKDADRYQTLAFLESMKKNVYSYSVSIFHAVPGTPIYTTLENFYSSEIVDISNTDINKLYYTEASYEHIYSFVYKTACILRDTHSNRYCYSGRIFQDSPEPPGIKICFDLSLKSKRCLVMMKKIFLSGAIFSRFNPDIWSFVIDLHRDHCEIIKRSHIKKTACCWGLQETIPVNTIVQNDFSSSLNE